MTIFAWIVLGIATGVLAGRLQGASGNGVDACILAAVVGAVGGGWAFTEWIASGTQGFGWASLPAAALGAVSALVLHRLARRVRIPR